MRVKKMKKTWLLGLVSLFIFSATTHASIAPQMINLNLKFKANDQIANSELTMPLYQTAELEKKLGKKNYFMSFVPRQGDRPGEVAIEIKFMKQNNSKVIFKKEVIAKLNQQSIISAQGMMIQLTPVI